MPGLGIYGPDATEGITRIEDLPAPRVIERSRNYPSRTCPKCGGSAGRLRTDHRTLHDLGDPASGRPRDLHVTYSQHRCRPCRADDPPKSIVAKPPGSNDGSNASPTSSSTATCS